MKERIDKVIVSAPGGEADYIEHTGWFDDSIEAETALAEYEPKYETCLAQVVALMGPPVFTDATDRTTIDLWYPEAIRMVCWDLGDRVFFVSLEQHDKETPIGIVLGCKTKAEIEELSQGEA